MAHLLGKCSGGSTGSVAQRLHAPWSLTTSRVSHARAQAAVACIAGLANRKNLTRSEKFLAEIGLRTS